MSLAMMPGLIISATEPETDKSLNIQAYPKPKSGKFYSLGLK